MSGITLTQEQQQVVFSDNRELLVSAAAGSGKTAVLVERIVHLIRNKGYSIDRMLVVTYTRAAASELRDKLETRFYLEAQNDPQFRKQAELAQSAQISTIHSYCQKVVKENFRFCDIDPQFIIGDERTKQTLFTQAMEETLDAIYALAKEDENIKQLVKKYPEKELAPMIQKLYEFMISRPDPLEWLEKETKLQWSENSLAKHPAMEAMITEQRIKIEGIRSIFQKAWNLRSNPAMPEKYVDTMISDKQTIDVMTEMADYGFNVFFSEAKKLKFVRLPVAKATTSDEADMIERFKKIRSSYKEATDKLLKNLPANLTASIEELNAMIPSMKGLYRVMEMLLEHFEMMKLDRAAIDFNDLEHMTIRILQNEELRKVEADRFDAVFVDEYQDVSDIQEFILNGLKREDSPDKKKQYFFYVGDVKQSIYRFRLAEPRLLLSKLDAFSEEETSEKRKIILNKNFRSREGILDGVNRTFQRIMDRRITEIDYDKAAMLYPGKESENDPDTELHLCQIDTMRDAARWEAELIAKDILQHVGNPLNPKDDQSPTCKFSDHVILVPVSKGVSAVVEEVLTKHQIPVYSDANTNALGEEECISAVQHLLLLDNVRNDTALIAELRSPIFDMTEQELAQIRLEKPEKEASFWDALLHNAENGKTEYLRQRCKTILATLEEERFLYQNMQPAEYLWDFLMRSGMYAHYGAQPGGKLRQANLRMLCMKAGEYFTQHQEGMSGFLETVSKKTAGDETSPTIVNPWENVVRIMTIHKSKGLEFPNVYVMGMGGNLSKKNTQKEIAMHGQLGLGIEYRNEKRRTKRKTILMTGIECRKASEEKAEKARVLYVAMTRPKNRLVMIGSYKGEKNGLESITESIGSESLQNKDLSAISKATCYLDWLRMAISPQDEYILTEGAEFETINQGRLGHGIESDGSRSWKIYFHNGLEKSALKNMEPFSRETKGLETVREAVNTPIDMDPEEDPLRPSKETNHLPLKIGVTALCRAMLENQNLEEISEEDSWETAETKRLPLITQRPRLLSTLPSQPEFIKPLEENTAAMRGTITHKLISMLKLDQVRQHLEKEDLYQYILEETQNMVQENILKKEEAELINRKKICAFFQSDIGRRMLQSENVHREWSFNLRITHPIETIVQGVIDLCFLEDDQWALLDFKTDRVDKVEQLWDHYRMQIEIYKQALQTATQYPVKEMNLYSLSLGENSTKTAKEI